MRDIMCNTFIIGHSKAKDIVVLCMHYSENLRVIASFLLSTLFFDGVPSKAAMKCSTKRYQDKVCNGWGQETHNTGIMTALTMSP